MVITNAPEEGVGLKQSLLRNIINTEGKKKAKRCFHYEVTLMSANPLSLNQQPETSQSWQKGLKAPQGLPPTKTAAV